MSSLLYGVASEEYLSFCDNASLDELSYSLKPVPRRMFEYYRTKIWRVDNDSFDVMTSGKVSATANVDVSTTYSQVVHRSESSGCFTIQTPGISKNVEHSDTVKDDNHESPMRSPPNDLPLSEASYHESIMPKIATTGMAETAGFVAKLPLFFADSRVAR